MGGSADTSMKVSVILPVMNEVESLRATVSVLKEENGLLIHEILIITSPEHTSPATVALATQLAQQYPLEVLVVPQILPFLGGAVCTGFQRATGTHVLLMASDFETDPHVVPTMIQRAVETHADVVTATRWAAGAGFSHYGFLKKAANWAFQYGIRILYNTECTDATYGFRLLKREVVERIRWEELKHPLLMETLLKPIRLGYAIIEVPAVWRPRQEGVSHNSFAMMLSYSKTAWRIRWENPAHFIRF